MKIAVLGEKTNSAQAVRGLLERSVPDISVIQIAESDKQDNLPGTDLLIIDLEPLSKGLRIIKHIRNRYQIPILLILNDTDSMQVLCQVLQMGTTDYIYRPILQQELIDRVRTLAAGQFDL